MVPVGAGFAATLLLAFGWLPAIGGTSLTLDPWRALIAAPGLSAAIGATLASGVGATIVSVAVTIGFAAACHRTRLFRASQAALAPILATPHAAFAIGFAFLVAPSGWIARLVAPLAGWDRPPDITTLADPWGLALMAGLVVKEVPYLLLMLTAALGQVRADQALVVARSLGYGPVTGWLKVVLPLIWPKLRLPVLAVLAYALSVVDVAIILGPSDPPTLAVWIVRRFQDRELAQWFPAASGAVLLLGIVIACALSLVAVEHLVRWAGLRWIEAGSRGGPGQAARAVGAGAMATLLVVSAASLAAIAIWSVAVSWRFPHPIPQSVSLVTWAAQAASVRAAISSTILIALAATALSLGLAIACLEAEDRFGWRPGRRALLVLYLPLLVPQTGFLFGVQVVLVGTGLDGAIASVIAVHLLFVMPYVFLTLAEPWRAIDPRLVRTATALGAGPWRVLVFIKIPLLAKTVLVAAAIGIAVSVGQYLPTLFAGAGRIATLTTEAVTLASGADRRVLGVFAAAQAGLPLLVYALAIALPWVMFRNRAAMR